MWTKKDATLTTIKDVVLHNTGLSESEFLHPPTDPHLENLDKVVEMLAEAIDSGSHITICGDYDADGVTASAILYMALTQIADEEMVTVRLPRRFSEGFGLSEKAVSEITDGLLITVDNGIAAAEAVQMAKDKGLTVIVTDHHLVREDGVVPNADCILNPHVPGDKSEFDGYCGAGLAYRIAKSLLGESHPIMEYLIQLAAVGTVADVMQLLFDNRNIVRNGLELMSTKSRYGLRAIQNQFDMEGTVTEGDIGFKLGPVINAAGRLLDNGAMKAFNTLISTDEAEAHEYAKELYELNEQRKQMVKDAMAEVERIINEDCLHGDSPLVVSGEFPEGIVGIIAGRLVEKYNVPAIVLSPIDDGKTLKGSGRSYGDLNLKELLDTASDLMSKYGGHQGAAGLSLPTENLEDFRMRLMENLPEIHAAESNTLYDLEISQDEIDGVYSELAKYAPYGEGNPGIIFKIREFRLSPRAGKFFNRLGADASTLKLFGSNADAIGFGLVSKYEDENEPRICDLYGTLSKNTFYGKTVNQIELLDVERSPVKRAETSLMGLLSKQMSTFNNIVKS